MVYGLISLSHHTLQHLSNGTLASTIWLLLASKGGTHTTEHSESKYRILTFAQVETHEIILILHVYGVSCDVSIHVEIFLWFGDEHEVLCYQASSLPPSVTFCLVFNSGKHICLTQCLLFKIHCSGFFFHFPFF